MYRSAVNSPNRVFLNSQNDPSQSELQPNNPQQGTFNAYRINFETPILNPKKVMLVRSAIPTTALNIPDYMGIFAVQVVPSVGGLGLQPDPTQFTVANLKWFAFSPFNPQLNQANAFQIGTHNRPIASYSDFVTFLNNLKSLRATGAGSPGGTDTTWNNITFTLDTVNQQIDITTTTGGSVPANSFICVPGQNDPNLVTLTQQVNTLYGYNFLPQYPLSLRVGYTSPNTPRSAVPGLCVPFGGTLTPQGFPNLVFTQNVQIYSDIVAGSSTTSTNRQNLLGIADMAVPPLGVSLWDAGTIQYLNTRVREIFAIGVELRDDNDQPQYLPDNSVVNLELSFYQDDSE